MQNRIFRSVMMAAVVTIVSHVMTSGFEGSSVAAATSSSSGIPFRFIRNQVLVSGYIKGHGPYTMLLDTGSPTCVLDDGTARRTGLWINTSHYKAEAVGEKDVIVRTARVPHIAIGNAVAWNTTTYILDMEALSSKIGETIHGVIGYAFLRDKILQIDYPGRRVRFLKRKKKHGGNSVPSTLAEMTMIFPGDSHMPAIDNVIVNGHRIEVTLDTGSALGLVLFPVGTRKAGMMNDREHAERGVIYGLGGKAEIHRSRVNEVRLGPYSVANMEIVYDETQDRLGLHDGRDGSLGNDFLKYFTVTLDYVHHIVRMQRPGTGTDFLFQPSSRGDGEEKDSD